jgi:hypothetical protein
MMKCARRFRIGILLALGSLAVGVIAGRFRGNSDPGSTFRAITGRELPAGVHATAYTSETGDNLFRATH